MRRIPKSFTLSRETIKKLESYAISESLTQSRVVEMFLDMCLEDTEDKKLPETVEEKRVRAETVENDNKEYLKNHPIDSNHVTPQHFDKVEILGGEPKHSFIKE